MNRTRTHAGREATQQSVVSSPSRRRRVRTPGIRGLLSIAAAIGVGISIAVLAAGGSYAYLNVTVTTGATGSTITAGTSGLTLKRGADPATSTLTIPASVYANMLPGDVVSQTLTLANTGDARQAVTALITSDGAWETRIAPAACAGTLMTTALSSTPVSLTTLAAGASQAICVQVVLPVSAPGATMGTSLGYTLTLSGTQVAA
ncbi:MAG: hypothetical protein J0H23_11065 [Micrococcales bacterium]|nr:hypothetical protein [Micrococcales bacterium]OJX69494.1 MAG: hypothetical protein BGO94_13355 [Micrococcales bacterium 72-143]